MLICLLRHGATAYNEDGRYQGRTDLPLSPSGRAALTQADFSPETVCVDFGAFEGRSFREMEHDTDYRAWVEGGCAGRCPGGESREAFSARVCGAFAHLVDGALASGAERLVIVAHGGVQMAALERFALPRRGYFDWRAPCGGGFLLDAAPWGTRRLLDLAGEIRYAKD